MPLPFFYKAAINPSDSEILLDEETSRHVVQVLRMQKDEQLQLTDGRGNLLIAAITDAHKKKCAVTILSAAFHPPPEKKICIAISLIKNASRFEWFLEKATEIGVTEIIPLLCSRTEKQHFRAERLSNILISAMLQSQQIWLPLLREPMKLSVLANQVFDGQKFIAHCEAGEIRSSLTDYHPAGASLVLIGPEGDFTTDEIQEALQHDFIPVSLGNTRLRTETAGMVAAAVLALA